MAKRKPKKANIKQPFVRGLIRELVKDNKQDRTIRKRVEEKFPNTHASTVTRILNEERRNKKNIDRLMGHDKRKKVNFPNLFGCPDGSKVMVRVSVELWSVEEQRYKKFDTSVELPNNGVVGTTLKNTIKSVLDHANEVAEGKYRSTSVNRIYGDIGARVTIESINCQP